MPGLIRVLVLHQYWWIAALSNPRTTVPGCHPTVIYLCKCVILPKYPFSLPTISSRYKSPSIWWCWWWSYTGGFMMQPSWSVKINPRRLNTPYSSGAWKSMLFVLLRWCCHFIFNIRKRYAVPCMCISFQFYLSIIIFLSQISPDKPIKPDMYAMFTDNLLWIPFT